ncbi:MAG TPA: hypothetical protein VFK94_02415, partial [Patescibacteria group bacterium]|nr:hypothetical protein [Patescibacteria group bacterium]
RLPLRYRGVEHTNLANGKSDTTSALDVRTSLGRLSRENPLNPVLSTAPVQAGKTRKINPTKLTKTPSLNL